MKRFAALAFAATVSADESALMEVLSKMEERISNLEGALGHVQGVLKSHLEAYIAQANQRLDAIDSSCDSAEQSWGAATSNATCTALDGGELNGAITQ